jgi:hypothetical protein
LSFNMSPPIPQQPPSPLWFRVGFYGSIIGICGLLITAAIVGN